MDVGERVSRPVIEEWDSSSKLCSSHMRVLSMHDDQEKYIVAHKNYTPKTHPNNRIAMMLCVDGA